ncbi:glycosyltransferase family 2 protein, partial [Vibrio sp. 10N.261.54.A5]|uniref:glycosyltransferase family 2 protein n=1 Tax=Vibrio sp. 10N.261.54.A5 TaxID=3229686 RepID=UPI003550A45F
MSYSVVIPTFNSSSRIEESIISVLKQSVPPVDIFVVDDCSDDINELQNVCKKYEIIKVISKTVKSNAAHSRNIGWLESEADYVLFLDSDDLWTPVHAEECLKVFDENKEIMCVFGAFHIKISPNAKGIKKTIGAFEENKKGYIFEGGNDFRTSTVAVRRKLYDFVHFDSSAKKHQDWDLYLSLIKSDSLVKQNKEPTVIINCYGGYRMSSENNLDASFQFLSKWWDFLNSNSKSFIIFLLVKTAILSNKCEEIKEIRSRYYYFLIHESSIKLK